MTVTITITGSDPTLGTLILSDNNITEAGPGDTIVWEFTPNSGVYCIESIGKKTGSANIFYSGRLPQQIPGSNSWNAVIDPSISSFEEETYYIRWKPSVNGPIVTDDPKIKVRPDQSHD